MTRRDLPDRSTAVQSIRPVYVDGILGRMKRIEFRRRPLPASVEQVLIWRTGPGGGIVGSYRIGEQVTQPAAHWCAAFRAGREIGYGIGLGDLVDYAGGNDAPLTGIRIADVTRYPRTLHGWELGVDTTPQSWRYAPAGWQTAVRVALADLVTCTGGHGSCERPAEVYVFGQLPTEPGAEGRLTIVGGPRSLELARNNPAGARCADHADEQLDTDAERSAIARAVTSGRLLSDVARDHDLPESTVREIAAGTVRETSPGERAAYDRVLAALDPLDDPARSRVLRWARDRYTPSALGAAPSPPGGPDA